MDFGTGGCVSRVGSRWRLGALTHAGEECPQDPPAQGAPCLGGVLRGQGWRGAVLGWGGLPL